MNIIIKKENLPMSAEQIARRASYGFIYDKKRGKGSFVRHPNRGRYPRFHMYIKEQDGKVIFDLHLDQKQASYKGVKHMHNAEYDGKAVENEILRLKKIISDLYQKHQGEISKVKSEEFNKEEDIQEKTFEDKLGYAEIDKNLKIEKKKPWWKFWN